jgi:hypothetical protein
MATTGCRARSAHSQCFVKWVVAECRARVQASFWAAPPAFLPLSASVAVRRVLVAPLPSHGPDAPRALVGKGRLCRRTSAVDTQVWPSPLHPNGALHSPHTPPACLDHLADCQLLPSDCPSMVGSPVAGLPPATPATPAAPASAGSSQVGSLCDNLPAYVYDPPIETVVFAWGVNEDGQLGLESAGAGGGNVLAPKVVEACLGERLLSPAGAAAAHPPKCMHAAFRGLPVYRHLLADCAQSLRVASCWAVLNPFCLPACRRHPLPRPPVWVLAPGGQQPQHPGY